MKFNKNLMYTFFNEYLSKKSITSLDYFILIYFFKIIYKNKKINDLLHINLIKFNNLKYEFIFEDLWLTIIPKQYIFYNNLKNDFEGLVTVCEYQNLNEQTIEEIFNSTNNIKIFLKNIDSFFNLIKDKDIILIKVIIFKIINIIEKKNDLIFNLFLIDFSAFFKNIIIFFYVNNYKEKMKTEDNYFIRGKLKEDIKIYNFFFLQNYNEKKNYKNKKFEYVSIVEIKVILKSLKWLFNIIYKSNFKIHQINYLYNFCNIYNLEKEYINYKKKLKWEYFFNKKIVKLQPLKNINLSVNIYKVFINTKEDYLIFLSFISSLKKSFLIIAKLLLVINFKNTEDYIFSEIKITNEDIWDYFKIELKIKCLIEDFVNQNEYVDKNTINMNFNYYFIIICYLSD